MHNLSPKRTKKKKAQKAYDNTDNSELHNNLKKAMLANLSIQKKRKHRFLERYVSTVNRTCGGENPIDYDEERPLQTGERNDNNGQCN